MNGSFDSLIACRFGEAHGVGVVSVVLNPRKGEGFAAGGIADNGGRDGEAVLAVGEHDHS